VVGSQQPLLRERQVSLAPRGWAARTCPGPRDRTTSTPFGSRPRPLVEFAANKAAYVTSRTWHDSQRIEVMPDGAVRVSMRLPALGPVRSWILEWGATARALEPSKLVDAIAEEARRTAARYPTK